jgi:uncharacterized membrane protein
MTWALAIVGSVVFGGLLERPAGFAIGAALGYLLGRVLQFEAELRVLRQQQRILEESIGSVTAGIARPASQTPATTAADVALAATPEHKAASPEVVTTQATSSELDTEADALADTWPPSPPIAPSRPVTPPPLPRIPAPSLAQRALAWLRGGNPLARVGIVILFFGGAFLAKYAAEHSRFPIELRMATLAAGALTLLGLGWHLREKRAAYAQILQGGGIAGLYLTVFATTRLYNLLIPSYALALLVLIAAVAATLAVLQNALALAVIGTAGGFMAPILLSTGNSDHIALFSYYTVLNLGVFAVAWFRAWRVLNLVGFVFTFGIVGVFRAMSYSPEKLISADGFLLLYFLLYIAITVLFALRQKPDLKSYVSGSLVFGLPLATFGIHGSMIERYEYGLAWSALGFGLFYLSLAGLLHRLRRENVGLLAEAFAALGVIFGSLAIPMAFDHHTTAASWAVEGAGLVWIGMRQQRWFARAFGLLLQLLGGGAFLLDLSELVVGPPLLNNLTIGATLLAISGVLSGLWLHRNRVNARAREPRLEIAATLWGVVWWFYGGFSEIARTLTPFERGADLILLTSSAALLWLIGKRQAWPLAQRLPAALLPTSAIIGILTWPEHPLAQAMVLGWPLVFVVHYALLYLNEKDDDPVVNLLRPWLHASAYWLLAFLAAWELHWQIEQQLTGVWSNLPWGLAPALLLLLCGRTTLWPVWPLQRHASAYREIAAPLLAFWSTLWLLAMNIGSDGNPGRLLYAPLLNPLDVASVLELASIALWWRQLSPQATVRGWLNPPLWPRALFAVLVFVWLNAALIRALHYGIGTPLSSHGIAHSIVVQAALSIFWGVFGFSAMIWSARSHQREIWMAGAGLMSIVVIKLFAVDTSGSGTLARIAAFLSVGALLLLTGYLSPLPPRATGEESLTPR